MIDRFEGDLKLYLTVGGATVHFKSGQPDMDPGVENAVQIALLTERFGEYSNQNGYWGNLLELNPDNKIGSNFVENLQNRPINLRLLTDAEQLPVKILDGDVTANAVNSGPGQIDIEIIIKAPSDDKNILLTLKNGVNWLNQATKGIEFTAPSHTGTVKYRIGYLLLDDQGRSILDDQDRAIVVQHLEDP